MGRNSSDPARPIADQIADSRGESLGLGRIVMAVFWAFGLWTTTVAVVDLFTLDGDAPGPVVLALAAGLIYLVAAVGITHNGRRMRIVGWVAVVIEAVGPVAVGLLGLGDLGLSQSRSAWAEFGASFWYLPLPIAVIGLVWLWASNPRRIVARAEQVERFSTTRARRRH